jgi:hypothetical protein
MHKEYRRFLLKKEILSLLDDLKTKSAISTIFFTKIKLCKEIKYEQIGNHYTRIIQTGAPHAQSTTYKNISKQRFKKKKTLKQGMILKLEHYLLKIDTCNIHIEVYKEHLKGLSILTIPARCFTHQKPDILHTSLIEKYIEHEISDDPRYEQKYLALFGNPTKYPYNIYSIFKDLERKRLLKPEEIIFKEMKSADAIRIFLYHQYLLIQEYAQLIQNEEEKKADTIEKFHQEITRSIAIMQSYEEIFDEQQYQKIIMHLYTLTRITKIHQDLMLIYHQLIKLNHKLNSSYIQKMIDNIQIKLSAEEHKISKYVESREFAIISNQYALFIREKSRSYTNYESQLPFGYSAKIKVHNSHSELLHTINFLDGCNDEKSYDKLKNAFEELVDFVTIFEKQIDSDSCKPLLLEARQIFTMLQKYEKRNKYLLILKMLKLHLAKEEQKEEFIYLRKKEKKLLQKQKRFDKNIFKHLENFKDITL